MDLESSFFCVWCFCVCCCGGLCVSVNQSFMLSLCKPCFESLFELNIPPNISPSDFSCDCCGTSNSNKLFSVGFVNSFNPNSSTCPFVFAWLLSSPNKPFHIESPFFNCPDGLTLDLFGDSIIGPFILIMSCVLS